MQALYINGQWDVMMDNPIPDMTPKDDPRCGQKKDGHSCTLPVDHPTMQPHLAGDGERIVAIWWDEEQMRPQRVYKPEPTEVSWQVLDPDGNVVQSGHSPVVDGLLVLGDRVMGDVNGEVSG